MTEEDLTPGERQLREESGFLDSLPDGGPAEWSLEQIKRWVECRIVCHHEYARAAMRKLIAEIDKAGRVLHSMITGGEWDPEVRFQAGRAAGIAEEHARACELIGAAAPLHWAATGDQETAHAWEKRVAQYVQGVPLQEGQALGPSESLRDPTLEIERDKNFMDWAAYAMATDEFRAGFRQASIARAIRAAEARGEARGREGAELRGREAEKADVIAYARELNYGPTLRTFLKHVARDEHQGKAGSNG